MKLGYSNELVCCICGADAVDEQDMEDGGTFYPAVALCGLCCMTRTPTVEGAWHVFRTDDIGLVWGQS